MGWLSKKPSGDSSGTSTNRDPYISGNRNDWNNRDPKDGETARKPKDKKDKK
jgi:hypothetical protein